MIEYVVKVGGMFINGRLGRYTSTVMLSPSQFDAARFDNDQLTETINFLILHNVPYQVFKIDGTAEAVNFVPAKNKETV